MEQVPAEHAANKSQANDRRCGFWAEKMQLEFLPRVMNAFVPFLFLILKVAVPKVFWHSLIVAEEAKRNNINFISYTMWDVPNLDYFGMFLIRLPRVTLMFYVLSDCSSLHVYIYNYIYIFFLYLCTYTDMHVYNYIYIHHMRVWVCGCVGAFVYSM